MWMNGNLADELATKSEKKIDRKPEVLGTPPLDARPLGWGPGMGLRALTPVGKCLHYNYSPVCGLPIRMVWGLIIS